MRIIELIFQWTDQYRLGVESGKQQLNHWTRDHATVGGLFLIDKLFMLSAFSQNQNDRAQVHQQLNGILQG